MKKAAEQGSPEFYRREATRLAQLAASAQDIAARLELLDFAAAFQKLAERGALMLNAPSDPIASKTA